MRLQVALNFLSIFLILAECTKPERRIFNGTVTEREQFRWTIAIMNSDDYVCVGTIIDSYFILTVSW
jgi:hypothetical protein